MTFTRPFYYNGYRLDTAGMMVMTLNLKENPMPLAFDARYDTPPIIPCANCGEGVRFTEAGQNVFVEYDADKEVYHAGYVHVPMTCKPMPVRPATVPRA